MARAKKQSDKLADYAKKLEKAKERARKEIKNLKNSGFSVDPSIIELANSPTPARIAKTTLDRAMIGLNLNRIRSTRTIDIKEVNNVRTGGTPISTNPINTGIKVTGLKKTINDILKNAKPSDRLGNDLAVMVKNLSGKLPEPGLETEYFKIDDKFDPSRSYELSKHIKFKKMDPKTAKIILQNPFTNEAANEVLQKDIHHRAYLTTAKKYLDEDDYDVSVETLSNLENIMNSSLVWRKCIVDEKDSDQTLNNWKKLYKRFEQGFEESDLDTLLNMLDNDLEDIYDIIAKADEFLDSYRQQKGH